MSDVVVKKSRLELEKEAAVKAQMEEKENELRRDIRKGVVIKFEVNPIEAPALTGRGSKSPSKATIAHGRPSLNSIKPSHKGALGGDLNK